MKFFKFKIKATWLATWLSVVTMVMSPVAMGQEAQNISKQQVQNALDQLGLNKSMTVGDFYEKNKNLFPERIRKEIEPVFASYKNVMMPEFQVTSATGPDGREIPNLTLSQNGQLFNIQWFGGKDKYVKFQNTNLSEIDIINFTDMFSRVLNGDAVLRKQSEVNQAKAQSSAKGFTGLPVLSADTWKKMTVEERVTYMAQVRFLWEDAKKVLREQDKLKGRKSAESELNFNFLEKAWAFLDGIQAEAASKASKSGKGPALSANAPKRTSEIKGTYGESCLVAGYLAVYKNGVCDYSLIKDEYQNFDDVKKAQSTCGSSQAACNPLIYGNKSDGGPICVPLKDPSFQKATHFSGPCEAGSSLHSKDESSILKDEKLKENRYSTDNLKSEDERRELFRKEQQSSGFSQSQAFIDGILKSRNKSMKDFYVNGIITADGLKELSDIQAQFNDQISKSTTACEAVVNSGKAKYETNFVAACDQLHRRFLFIGEILGKDCKDGSVINSASLKCTCTDTAKTEVMPGASCKGAATPPPAADEKDKPDPNKDKKDPKEKKKKGGVTCSATEHEETIVGAESGAADTRCVSNKPDKVTPAAAECGILCKIGNFVKPILPIALGLGAIYLMYKIFSPKKPKLNPPGDTCPTGATAPCTTVCPLPLANVNGVCGCAACPPGQTLASTTTCTCGTTTTTTGNTLTCWDGVTKVSDLTLCPAQKYTCWDGSSVTNPLNCPEKPATTTTTTTTTTNKTGR